MHNVLTMLSQQQAILAMLVEARRPPPPARPTHPTPVGTGDSLVPVPTDEVEGELDFFATT